MKKKIEALIVHVENSDKISEESRPAIIQKLIEWQEEDDAVNDVATRFEEWWLEIEPLFAELGWI